MIHSRLKPTPIVQTCNAFSQRSIHSSSGILDSQVTPNVPAACSRRCNGLRFLGAWLLPIRHRVRDNRKAVKEMYPNIRRIIDIPPGSGNVVEFTTRVVLTVEIECSKLPGVILMRVEWGAQKKGSLRETINGRRRAEEATLDLIEGRPRSHYSRRLRRLRAAKWMSDLCSGKESKTPSLQSVRSAVRAQSPNWRRL